MSAPVRLEAKTLARLKTFSTFSAAQLSRLAEAGIVLRVKRGAPIFEEGGLRRHVFVLIGGAAKLLLENASQFVLVGFLGPGDVFGLSALLPNAERPFRCEAFVDSTIASIDAEEFSYAMLGVDLERFSRTLEITMGRWWRLLIRYSSFTGLSLRDRLAGALLEVAEKFGATDSRGTLITIKLTHADLAELVGASRQRTTEQLIEFEREGAIIRDGRRLIIVEAALTALTGRAA
jgi:CRP/FNR family transcriptional regulator